MKQENTLAKPSLPLAVERVGQRSVAGVSKKPHLISTQQPTTLKYNHNITINFHHKTTTMLKKTFLTLLRYTAISGNILFILWLAFNAIGDGFNGPFIEKVSAATLTALLGINSIFLLNKHLITGTNKLSNTKN